MPETMTFWDYLKRINFIGYVDVVIIDISNYSNENLPLSILNTDFFARYFLNIMHL